MKKKQITFDKKLSLNRDTISKLDNDQLSQIYGGMEAGGRSCNCGGATATCNGGSAEEALEGKSCNACSCC